MGRNTADGMDQALGQVFSLGGPCDVASGSASGRLRSSTGGAALGLPVHRAAYRTGYDAGPKGSRWCLREGDRERHGPGGRRD
jgi:hypothetical protein